MLKTLGKTSDGRQVVGGLFHAHDTLGVPLGISLTILLAQGRVPDLDGFIRDAWKAAWAPEAIVSRLREAVTDVHGIDHWTGMESRIQASFLSIHLESQIPLL